MLIRCNLPISLCRGQAYDGADNMQGKKSEVATRFRAEQPAAIPGHCFAHSLNLCLKDVGKKLMCIRDALETVQEISDLIGYSPERLHFFFSKLSQISENHSVVTLKPLSQTRWTARTVAIEAVLKDYSVLMDTLEEISQTTHDEYGSKAAGLMANREI